MPLTREAYAAEVQKFDTDYLIQRVHQSKEEYADYLLNQAIGLRDRRTPQTFIPGGIATLVTWYLNNVPHPGLNPGDQYIRKTNIRYQGTRTKDFEKANEYVGFDATPQGYVWHHFHDYNSTTNQGTMYLMQRQIHDYMFHWGGVSQYVYHNPGAGDYT